MILSISLLSWKTWAVPFIGAFIGWINELAGHKNVVSSTQTYQKFCLLHFMEFSLKTNRELQKN
jgi:hypothetical protein